MGQPGLSGGRLRRLLVAKGLEDRVGARATAVVFRALSCWSGERAGFVTLLGFIAIVVFIVIITVIIFIRVILLLLGVSVRLALSGGWPGLLFALQGHILVHLLHLPLDDLLCLIHVLELLLLSCAPLLLVFGHSRSIAFVRAHFISLAATFLASKDVRCGRWSLGQPLLLRGRIRWALLQHFIINGGLSYNGIIDT